MVTLFDRCLDLITNLSLCELCGLFIVCTTEHYIASELDVRALSLSESQPSDVMDVFHIFRHHVYFCRKLPNKKLIAKIRCLRLNFHHINNTYSGQKIINYVIFNTFATK